MKSVSPAKLLDFKEIFNVATFDFISQIYRFNQNKPSGA